MTIPALVSFPVPGAPVGKARARVTKRGTFTPRQSKQYEASVQWAAKQAMAGMNPMQGPLRMVLHCYMPIPASWSKKRQALAASGAIEHVCKPDASNIAKSIEDACNGIVYRDDSQIVELRVLKRYSRDPQVDVIVCELTEDNP